MVRLSQVLAAPPEDPCWAVLVTPAPGDPVLSVASQTLNHTRHTFPQAFMDINKNKPLKREERSAAPRRLFCCAANSAVCVCLQVRMTS